MVDLDQQIAAWAEAVAPPADDPVTADEVLGGGSVPATGGPGAGPSHRGRWLAAAAVLVLLAGAVVVARRATDDGSEHLRTGDPDRATTTTVVTTTAPPTTSTASTTSPPGPSEPVAFRSLARSPSTEESPGSLHSAQVRGEVGALWVAAQQLPPVPDVDLDREVVLSITTWGSPCDVLTAMVRTGTRLAPRFEERAEGQVDPCNSYLVRATFLVAVPWAETGDDFTLAIPAHESQYPDLPETAYGHRELRVTRTTDPEVVTTLALDATTVEAGGEIAGTVTVENSSGAPITGTVCGSAVRPVLTFANGYREELVILGACDQRVTVPEGTSTYPVVVRARYVRCLDGGQRPGASPYCGEDGQPPPLDAGSYLLTLQMPTAIPPPDPVTITVT